MRHVCRAEKRLMCVYYTMAAQTIGHSERSRDRPITASNDHFERGIILLARSKVCPSAAALLDPPLCCLMVCCVCCFAIRGCRGHHALLAGSFALSSSLFQPSLSAKSICNIAPFAFILSFLLPIATCPRGLCVLVKHKQQPKDLGALWDVGRTTSFQCEKGAATDAKLTAAHKFDLGTCPLAHYMIKGDCKRQRR